MRLAKTISAVILVVSFSNPKAIHWSAKGNYLVDQNGHRTVVHGHPRLRCFKGETTLEGTFQRSRGATIWIIADRKDGHPIGHWYLALHKPVCDLQPDLESDE